MQNSVAQSKRKYPEAPRVHARRAEALRGAVTTGIGFVRLYELAALLGVTRQTVWQWRRDGKIAEPVTIAGLVGYRADYVRALLSGESPEAA